MPLFAAEVRAGTTGSCCAQGSPDFHLRGRRSGGPAPCSNRYKRGHRPDSEILAARFKLSDAQEMVARQQGFDSWQALKTGLSTPSLKVRSSPSKATIVSAEPQLFVTDIERSCEFFRQKLGFSLVFSYGQPPYYAQVARDASRLNLRCVERSAIESTVRDREELLSVSMTVATADEIKLLFLEFQSAGVAFHQTLKKQSWGARSFVIKDPDGNLLLFAGPAN